MPTERDLKESPEEDEEEAEQADDGDEADDEPEVVEKTSRGSVRRGARAEPPGGRTSWQHFKARFRDVRLWVYTVFFAVSVVILVFGILSIWLRRAFGPWLEERFTEMGPWNTWLFIAGFFLMLTAAYLYGTLLSKKAEFHRLVATKSKGDFVHSLDRIERLAFELGTRENQIVVDRKHDFKIRH